MANQTVITGTGCYIPPVIKTNQEFIGQTFYAEDQKKIDADGKEIVEKFKEITGIEERRYADCSTQFWERSQRHYSNRYSPGLGFSGKT
jgi:3-oxoacyl-[acyl-carrier-protein] synthase-3